MFSMFLKTNIYFFDWHDIRLVILDTGYEVDLHSLYYDALSYYFMVYNHQADKRYQAKK